MLFHRMLGVEKILSHSTVLSFRANCSGEMFAYLLYPFLRIEVRGVFEPFDTVTEESQLFEPNPPVLLQIVSSQAQTLNGRSTDLSDMLGLYSMKTNVVARIVFSGINKKWLFIHNIIMMTTSARVVV